MQLDGANNTGNGNSQDVDIWTDLSGNNKNGEIVGATWRGKSLLFDGVNDWVNCDISNTDYKTMEITFLCNKLDTTENQYIFGNWNSSGGGILINSTTKKIAGQYNIGGTWYNVISKTEIKPNKEYTVSLTYDGKKIKLYINGILNSEKEISGVIRSSNSVVAIGRQPSLSKWFHGKVYSARIYDRALTDEEVKTNCTSDQILVNGFTNADNLKYTFIWDEDINKFTSSEINVENAVKETFTEVTKNREYDLVVKTPDSGIVKVSVPKGVCQGVSQVGNIESEIKSITVDKQGPTCGNVEIKNISPTGYDVYVYDVVDNYSGVNRIQFPTWTENNGKDDIQDNWETNVVAKGTLQPDGTTWVYRVNITDHNNEYGIYNTSIYLYDNLENCTILDNKIVDVPEPVASTTINGETTFYGTVQKAIDAGGTNNAIVRLLYTGSRTESVTVATGQNIILDTNNATLTSDGITLTNNGVLTVTGSGKIESISDAKPTISNYKTLTLQEINVSSINDRGVINQSTGKLTVSDSTIIAKSYAIFNFGTDNTISSPAVKVESGNLESTENNTIWNSGTGMIYLTGGIIKQANKNSVIYNSIDGIIQVSGATIEHTGTAGVGIKNINNGIIKVTDGNIISDKGTAIHNESSGTIIIGTNESTPSVSITVPNIRCATEGIHVGSGTFNFYDGIIQGAKGKSIVGEVSETPNGYVVVKTITGETETSVLGPSAPVIVAKLVNASGATYTSGWTNKNIYVSLISDKKGAGIKQYQWYENGNWVTRSLTTTNDIGTITYSANTNETIRFRAIDNNGVISEESSIILKIDKTPPTTTAPIATATTYSITVTNKQTDSLSGINKVQYAIKKGDTWSKWQSSNIFSNDGGIFNNTTYVVKTQTTDNAGNSIESEETTIKTQSTDYTITYNLNSGTVSNNPTTYQKGTGATVNAPTRAGYTFTGWSRKYVPGWGKNFINLDTGKLEANPDYPDSRHSGPLYLQKGVTYTINTTYTGSVRWSVYDLNGNYIDNKSITKTYTPTSDCYIRLLFYQAPTDEQLNSTTVTIGGTTQSGIIPESSMGNLQYIANWDINSYTVTYNYAENGGTSATKTTQSVNYNSAIDLTPTATKSGYTFVGWNTNKDATTGLTTLKMGTSNVTLYAIYKKQITATYHYYNNASTNETKTIYNKATSATFTLPSIANQTVNNIAYTKRGWSTNSGASATVISGTTVTISANTNYYASYTGTAEVTFYYNSGNSASSYTSKVMSSVKETGTKLMNYKGSYVEGNITVPTVVQNSMGYMMTRYGGVSINTNSAVIVDKTTVTTASTSYYAMYTKTMKYYYYDGTNHTSSEGTIRTLSDGTKYGNIAVNTPSPSAYDGANFVGWSYTSESLNSRDPATTVVSELYAYYQKALTVNYNHNYGNITEAVHPNRTYISKSGGITVLATRVTLKEVTREGYTFGGWYRESACTNKVGDAGEVQTISGSVTYYAKWTGNAYTIAYNLNGGTHGTNAPTSGTYGKDVQISNPTKKGYTFTGWSSGVAQGLQVGEAKTGTTANPTTAWNGTATKNTYFKNLRSDVGTVTLVANWNINSYTVTYNYAENGGTSATKTTQSVNYNSAIDLTPTATKSGYTFVGWNTNKDATTGLTTLKMGTSNVTLYAIYKKQITATYHYYNNASTNETKTIYNKATSATFTLPSIANQTVNNIAYTKRGWSTNSGASATVISGTTVTISANTNYYASYTGTAEVTFYYNSGNSASSYTSKVMSSVKETGTKLMNYKGSYVEGNITVPTVVQNSMGYMMTRYGGVSINTNSAVIVDKTTVTTASTSYYAMYTKTMKYYYYDGTNHTSSEGTIRTLSDGTKYGNIAVNTPSPSAYDGANFVGWSYTSESLNSRDPATTVVSELYAYYQKALTVNYNHNYGNITEAVHPNRTYISKSGGITVLATRVTLKEVTRKGYTFSGWYKEAGCTNKIGNAGEVKTISGSVTYYAKWTGNAYTIAYSLNGGTHGTNAPTSGTYAKDVQISNPTRTGYTFVGWTSSASQGLETDQAKAGTTANPTTAWSGTATKSTYFRNLRSASGTVTLVATWTPKVYTITLNNANATTTGSTSVYEKYGTGIYKESSCTNKMQTNSNGITIPKREYTITFDSNGGTSCDSIKSTYTFKGYYRADNINSSQMINGSGFITSNFATTSYSSNSTLYALWSGGVINLPTPTKEGYRFDGWCLTESNNNGTGTPVSNTTNVYVPTSTRTLYAKWTQYEAKVLASGSVKEDVYYLTLQDAIDALDAEKEQMIKRTIQLLKNVTYTASLEIYPDDIAIIDLNGYTITSSANYAIELNNQFGIDIRNGTIIHTGETGGCIKNIYQADAEGGLANLDLYNVNLQSSKGMGIYNNSALIHFSNGDIITGQNYCIDNDDGRVYISSDINQSGVPRITSDGYAIRSSGVTSAMYIDSGTITGGIVRNRGEITIGPENGLATSSYPWITANTKTLSSGYTTGKYIINSGTIETIVDSNWCQGESDIKIRDGYTTKEVKNGNGVRVSLVASTSRAIANADMNILRTNTQFNLQNNTIQQSEPNMSDSSKRVKVIGQMEVIEYDNLLEALLNAKNGEEVVLLQDIVLKEKITVTELTKAKINLNGYKLQSETGDVFENYGSLEIIDTNEGKIVGKITNYNNLEIKGGTIVDKEEPDEEEKTEFDTNDISILERKMTTIDNKKGNVTLCGGNVENKSNEGVVIYNSKDGNIVLKTGNLIANGSKAIGILNSDGRVVFNKDEEQINEANEVKEPELILKGANSIGIYNIGENAYLELQHGIITAKTTIIGNITKVLEGYKIRQEEIEAMMQLRIIKED